MSMKERREIVREDPGATETVSRNFFCLAIGALAVVGTALRYQSYHEQQRAIGLQMNVSNGAALVQDK